MWPLLQVLDILLLGTTAWLQQCDQLVLAISCEIEPVHIRKWEQTLDTFRGQVAYNVAVCPLTHTAQRSKTLIASLMSIFL